MKPRVSAITLGVADISRARAFYSDVLGWRAFHDDNGIVFYDLGGQVLGLWTHASLAKDMGAKPAPLAAYRGIVLAHNVGAPADVDAILKRVADAGHRILVPAAETFWGGYAGHIADADGHAWEIAHNPHWPLRDDGRMTLPEPKTP